MLSAETLEQYRRMSVGERLTLSLKLTAQSEPFLAHGESDQIDRKFELIRRENDERNRRMLEAMARTMQ